MKKNNVYLKRGSRQGIKRWVNYNNSFSGLAFLFQRITGLGLTIYFIIHVFSTSNIIFGEDRWKILLEFIETPINQTGELFLLAALGFHGINGLRLIMSGTGYTLDNPKRPDYPFKLGSFNFIQKTILSFSIIFAILLFIIGYFFIFVWK